MYIHLGFDRTKLQQRAERGSPLVFEIAWEHNSVIYPAPGWVDFGSVILAWWMRAAVELFEGAHHTDFLFMDGPYGFQAQYQEASGLVLLKPRNQFWEWVVPLDTIAQELVKAGNRIIRELYEVNLGEEDRRSLEDGIARIKRTILAQHTD